MGPERTLPPDDTVIVTARGRVIRLADLQRSLRRPRTLFNFLLTGLITLITLAALVPLFAVLYMLVVRGGKRLSLELFTQLPPVGLEQGGGVGNAIVGTIIMVTIAALISVPFGILAAVFLAEVVPATRLVQVVNAAVAVGLMAAVAWVFGTLWFGILGVLLVAFLALLGAERLAHVVRFCAKVLTGFPSILAGVFAYGAVVLLTGGFSAVAGGVALSILMLPTVMLTAEEAIRMVPAKMREAAVGMGATPTQVTLRVLLPTARPGMLTGVMLAVARAAGETAPLLFTALNYSRWPVAHGRLNLMQPTASLAVQIYNFSGVPYENQRELAWAAALVLVVLVLTTNLIGQFLSPKLGER